MALNNSIRLGVSILGLLGCAVAPAACDHATDIVTPVPLPSQITECETNTQRVCGTWSLVAGTRTYSATWPQGSQATISVVQFDSTAIVFSRVDTAGPTPDMNAHYVGVPSGAG
ncbi:MAG: hypothetical protein ACRD3J_22735, partial [Thermoanaerobaculia bacterium]